MDKDKIYYENRGLINFCKKKMNVYAQTQEEEEEIESAAKLGMARGINTYDETMNIKISTYLVKCICNQISRYLYLAAMQKRNNIYGRDVSLSTKVASQSSEEITLEDVLPSNDNVENSVVDKMFTKDMIEKALSVLKPRQKDMIIKYYGLYGEKQLDMQELGQIYGISKVAVGQNIQRAIEIMRKELKKCL